MAWVQGGAVRRTRGCISARFPHDRFGSVRAGIVEALLRGSTFKAACEIAGIHASTGRRWRKKDQAFDFEVRAIKLWRGLCRGPSW